MNFLELLIIASLGVVTIEKRELTFFLDDIPKLYCIAVLQTFSEFNENQQFIRVKLQA